jgi:hypothetical protein
LFFVSFSLLRLLSLRLIMEDIVHTLKNWKRRWNPIQLAGEEIVN